MKIAQVTYNLFPVGADVKDLPSGRVGAIEHVVQMITDSLVERGHDVTLFAAGDSKTKAKLVGIPEIATFHHPLLKNNLVARVDFEYFLLSQAAKIINKDNFDIVHTHTHIRSSIMSPFIKNPVISTLHTVSFASDNFILDNYIDTVNYVSISNAQRKTSPKLKYTATIYHGIRLNSYQFSQDSSNYLSFMGRIAKEKGLHTAVAVSRTTSKPLTFAGTVKEDYKEIFDSEVAPYIDGKQIIHKGALDHKEVSGLLAKSKAFIFPIEWEEPFGLVMVEAMACGTPVVAYARGSVPEVIKDGETGFIVNSSEEDKRGNWIVKKTGVEGLCEAVEKIYSMPQEQYQQMRRNCRAHVEKYFTVKRMVDEYEKLYQKILDHKI